MDYFDLLLDMLRTGLKIEITVKLDKQPQQRDEVRYPIECRVCQWSNTYASPDQARKGLNAKRQHCARDECPKHMPASPSFPSWVQEYVEGEEE